MRLVECFCFHLRDPSMIFKWTSVASVEVSLGKYTSLMQIVLWSILLHFIIHKSVSQKSTTLSSVLWWVVLSTSWNSLWRIICWSSNWWAVKSWLKHINFWGFVFFHVISRNLIVPERNEFILLFRLDLTTYELSNIVILIPLSGYLVAVDINCFIV